MARGEWGHNGKGNWCSYKKTALILCSVNTVIVLYVFRCFYHSLYMYTLADSQSTFRYTLDHIRKMDELNQIRKASEPTELIDLLTQLKTRFIKEEKLEEMTPYLRQKMVHEILDRLRSVASATTNASLERETIEIWRNEKLKEAKLLALGGTTRSTILPEEAGVVAKALSSEWAEFSENIGLWIPAEVFNREHDDKPEDEEEFDSRILPGRKLPPMCHAELHTDYDGVAVRWGLTHQKDSAFDCCMACLDQAKHAKADENKCNIWVYCPSETGCFSPDIYEHKNRECWLKYSEQPKLNFKDTYSESYREAHPNAPMIVPWVSGVVSV